MHWPLNSYIAKKTSFKNYGQAIKISQTGLVKATDFGYGKKDIDFRRTGGRWIASGAVAYKQSMEQTRACTSPRNCSADLSSWV